MFYAIGDLHLSQASDKPMDVFGETWAHHQQRIQENWVAKVKPDDVVLIPGDISWAMTLDEASLDLDLIGQLPGKKVMIRGNHDYWWNGISKVRSRLPKGMYGIQNDSMTIAGIAVCGTRGWLLPSHPQFSEDDERLLRREVERLHLSLADAHKTGLPKVCMIHYPPLGPDGEPTVFSELLEQYEVSLCVYGHLHGPSHRFRFDGMKNHVRYQLTSADYLTFHPLELDLPSA